MKAAFGGFAARNGVGRAWPVHKFVASAAQAGRNGPGIRLGVYTYADSDIVSIQYFIGRLSDLFLD